MNSTKLAIAASLAVLILIVAMCREGIAGDHCAAIRRQCAKPAKVACPVPDVLKKTTTQYSAKSEDMCLHGACCQTGLHKSLSKCCPSLGCWWAHITGGVIREKRSLQKVVETKEIPTCKCEVRNAACNP